MPIGLVDDSEFEKELQSYTRKVVTSTVPSVQIVEKPHRGRSDGDNNVPDSLRQIIGEESVINGRASALQLARDFGVSPSSVSAYANGATSTKSYDQPKSSIIQHINKSRARATKKAARVMASALSAITQEKLDYTDARDLSGIAKDMSAIIKNLEPPQIAGNNSEVNQQFVIYAPTFRREESFDVIDVKE